MLTPLETEEDKAVEEMKQYCPYKGSWKSTYEYFARELVRNGYRKLDTPTDTE